MIFNILNHEGYNNISRVLFFAVNISSESKSIHSEFPIFSLFNIHSFFFCVAFIVTIIISLFVSLEKANICS
jgi:hypothetical protein